MVKNFAHRGFSEKYPENTLLAFAKALEVGVDGIELDVHLTADNVCVITHDEWTDRTTGFVGFIKYMTYEQVSKLDAGATFKTKFDFQRIPTLDEYFQLIEGQDIITNIELKTSIFEYEGIEKIVYDIMCKYNRQKDVIISSFNHYSVERFKKLAPEVKCGLLESSWIFDFEEYTKSHGFDCIHPLFPYATPEHIDKARKLGLEVNVWTVDIEQYMQLMLQLNVDCVITNKPDVFKQLRTQFYLNK